MYIKLSKYIDNLINNCNMREYCYFSNEVSKYMIENICPDVHISLYNNEICTEIFHYYISIKSNDVNLHLFPKKRTKIDIFKRIIIPSLFCKFYKIKYDKEGYIHDSEHYLIHGILDYVLLHNKIIINEYYMKYILYTNTEIGCFNVLGSNWTRNKNIMKIYYEGEKRRFYFDKVYNTYLFNPHKLYKFYHIGL